MSTDAAANHFKVKISLVNENGSYDTELDLRTDEKVGAVANYLKKSINEFIRQEEIRKRSAEEQRERNIQLLRNDPGTDGLFRWDKTELDVDHLGMIDNYADLPKRIPPDFRIYDFGCNQAVQESFFLDFEYTGVDMAVPVEHRYHTDRPYHKHYNCTIQEFLEKNKGKMDLDKSIAICSGVSDRDAVDLVNRTFRFVCIRCPGEPAVERMPSTFTAIRPCPNCKTTEHLSLSLFPEGSSKIECRTCGEVTRYFRSTDKESTDRVLHALIKKWNVGKEARK